MKNYYFVGGKGAVIDEILNILRGKCILHMSISPGECGIYSVDSKTVDGVFSFGFSPILILCTSASSKAKKWDSYRVNITPSPLRQLASCENIKLSFWQNLVLLNDENRYAEYPYVNNIMADLRRMGYNRGQIEQVRAYDRMALGITAKEERETEKCLEENCFKQHRLIIVSELPHETYRTVTDRTFWAQSEQNVLVFTQNGNFFYVGFADVVTMLVNEFRVQYTNYYSCEGLYDGETEKASIIKSITDYCRRKETEKIL